MVESEGGEKGCIGGKNAEGKDGERKRAFLTP